MQYIHQTYDEYTGRPNEPLHYVRVWYDSLPERHQLVIAALCLHHIEPGRDKGHPHDIFSEMLESKRRYEALSFVLQCRATIDVFVAASFNNNGPEAWDLSTTSLVEQCAEFLPEAPRPDWETTLSDALNTVKVLLTDRYLAWAETITTWQALRATRLTDDEMYWAAKQLREDSDFDVAGAV